MVTELERLELVLRRVRIRPTDNPRTLLDEIIKELAAENIKQQKEKGE